MFNSFFPSRTKNVSLNTTENNDESNLNSTVQSKLDLSLISNDEKITKTNDYSDNFFSTPTKHVNINEKRETLEKQIFIDNLKTCPSPYSSYRRSENKFNAKDQINLEKPRNSNIYSQDPLGQTNASQDLNNDALLYEYIDLNQPTEQQNIEAPKPQQEDIVYDVINPNNERPVYSKVDDDEAGMYAIPKDI